MENNNFLVVFVGKFTYLPNLALYLGCWKRAPVIFAPHNPRLVLNKPSSVLKPHR